jgi:hypothetical protein
MRSLELKKLIEMKKEQLTYGIKPVYDEVAELM